MIFDTRHYVPILKVKRGEKKALGFLASSIKSNVTPLLEIVERTEKSIDEHLDTAFTDLASSVRMFDRCFIDTREISGDGPSAAEKVFQRATDDGIIFSPVTGISRTADVDAALACRGHGLVLRVTRGEFEEGKLGERVVAFLDSHSLAYEEVDLIVDLGPVDELIQPGIEALAEMFFSEIPMQDSWKTLTLAACAFPKVIGLEAHSNRKAERIDWLAWKNFVKRRNTSNLRLPSYSDCAIQHPVGVEGFDFRFMHMSATVRYTVRDSWLLIKGESTKRTLPTIQYIDLATQLVYGHLQPEYIGEAHCQGCESIKEAADGVRGHGSAEVWRRHGTVHHITTVVEDVLALP